jgi:predicted O-methyltransferase YrrM
MANISGAATLAYFDRITARANPGALLVFDDIKWSPGMRRAWQRIRTDTRVAVHSGTGRFGVVILSGKSYEPGGV